jgi:hypothetical protein
VAINILIAVASDFESAIKGISAGGAAGGWWLSSENVWLFGGWWNILNGLAGIINILCMTGWWGIYSSKNHQDMLWPDMTWCYILAYDVWNFEYTYNNLPTHNNQSRRILIADGIFFINKVHNSNKTLIFAETSLLTEDKHKV